MKTKIALFTWLLFLFGAVNAQLQNLALEKSHSLYTYIYKTSAKEAARFLKKQKLKPRRILQYACVDSFFTDSVYTGQLPAGNYLHVAAKERMLTVKYVPVTSLQVRVMADYNRSKLVVKNEDGTVQGNARVYKGLHLLKYNTGAQAYLLKYRRGKKIITVQLGADTTFCQLYREQAYHYKPSAKLIAARTFYPFSWVYYKIRRLIVLSRRYEGYMVFNKPKYQPNDTVRLKAFVTNGLGRPVKKPATIIMTGGYPEIHATLVKNLAPQTKGAFVYDFVLGDSVTMNTNYYVSLENKWGKTIRSGYFRAEDYLLNVNRYQAATGSAHLLFTDTLKLETTGSDFNGLPVMDGQVKILATVNRLYNCGKPQVFVPDTLIQYEGVLDEGGKLLFNYPAALFPAAAFNARLQVQCRNSNNEMWDTAFYFTYTYAESQLQTTIHNDTLYGIYLKNGKPTPGTGTLQAQAAEGHLYTRQIAYPLALAIDPFVESYFLTVAGDYATQREYVEADGKISCLFYRTDTTACVEVNNPGRIPFYYSLYRNGQLLEKGKSRTFNKTIPDKSDAVYILFIEYVWGGKATTKTFRADKLKKQLVVEMTGDDEIYPGQKDSINISVTTIAGKPMPDINLTAYSVNAQFEKDVQLPQLPGYERVKRIRKRYYPALTKTLSFFSTYMLYGQTEWRGRMHLDAQAYYHMVFPPAMASYYHDTIPYYQPQVAPYIYRHGSQIKIYALHIDKEFVYSSENQLTTPYAFEVKPGYHKISMRTQQHTFIIDSVYLKPGYKLEISYNYDSLAALQRPNRKKEYDIRELDELRRSMIGFSKDYYSTDYLIQGSRVFRAENSYLNKALAGPFRYDTITYYNPYKFISRFMPEPNYAYNFAPGNTRMKEMSAFKAPRKLTALYGTPHLFGEVARPLVMEFSYPPVVKIIPRYNIVSAGSKSNSGEGTLWQVMRNDSVFQYLYLACAANNFSRVYSSSSGMIYGLPPGNYQATFITASGNYLQVNNIEIKADGVNYYKWEGGTLKPFFHLSDTLFSPHVDSLQGYFRVNEKYGNLAIAGKIFSTTGNSKAYDDVYLLQHGDLKAITKADNNGDFIFTNIPAGVYLLRGSSPTSEVEMEVEIKDGYAIAVALRVREFVINEQVLPEVTIEREMAQMEMSMEYVSMEVMSVAGVTVTGRNSQAIPPGGKLVKEKARVNNTGNPGPRYSPVMGWSYSGDKEGGFALEDSISNKYSNAKTLRNNFSDYGFWQPNLVTDKNGKAAFAVQYPDNITSWKAYVLAMGKHFKVGTASRVVKSFKELNVSLNMPQFLIEGDDAKILGKVSNYTGAPLNVKTTATVNGISALPQMVTVKDVVTEKVPVHAGDYNSGNDTIVAVYTATLEKGYSDGEEKRIPVFPKGTRETKGFFKVLKGDTAFTLAADAALGDMTLHAEDDLLDVLLDEIEQLKNYPYGCAEQNAGKLIALSMQKDIYAQLGKPFKEERERQKLIKQLQEMQLFTGAFGWWQYTERDVYITAHVVRALYVAGVKPAASPMLSNATEFLKGSLNTMNTGEKLSALQVFGEYGGDMEWLKAQLKQFRFDSLDLHQQMQLVYLQLTAGVDSAAYWQSLLNKQHETALGGIYWGSETYLFSNNHVATTVLAYKIAALKKNEELKQRIAGYFLSVRSNTGWRNTYESALILLAVLPDALRERGKALQGPVLQVNGAQVSKFPYTLKVLGGSSVNVAKHNQAPLYFTAYQQFFNKQPDAVTGLFDINTVYSQGNKAVEKLKAGTMVEMTVNVHAHKHADYVFIEVPIPAGCTYAKNDFAAVNNEVHREYLKNKVLIFCRYLTPGDHRFKINLQARYSGSFTVNPVRAELMYFPVLYGRTGLVRKEIE